MRVSRLFLRRLSTGYILVLVMMGFLGFFVPVVHSAGPTVNQVSNSFSNTNINTVSGTVTVLAVNDVIFVATETSDGVTSNPSIFSTGVTDTAGDTFTEQVFKTATIGATCAAGNCYHSAVWSAVASSATLQTVTVTYDHAQASAQQIALQLYETTGYSATATGTATGYCTPSCSSMSTSTSNTFTAPVIAIAGETGCVTATCVGGSTFTVECASFGPCSEYSVGPPSSPTNYPISTSGGATTWTEAGAVFGTGGPTTVNNCIGACTGAPSGSNYLVSKRLYFTYAANGVSTSANLYNMTSQINHVHVTTATAAFSMGVYVVPGGFTPSATHPFVLIWSLVFTVTNSSDAAQSITALPNAPLCAGCYFAIALYTNANTSRGSGSSLSGISVPTSGLTFTQYLFDVGSSTHVIPSSFYSATTTTPPLYFKGFFQYTAVTSTATSTVTGAVSTTTTVTMTTLDQLQAIKGTTADAIVLLVVLLPAFAIMMPIALYTKSPQATVIGFVGGLMIGSGIGVQAALVPPVFLGITIIVGIFMIVGISRMGGGT